MRVRLEKDGAAIALDGPPMARGGEAAIFPLPERAALLGKVYHKPTPEQADKLAVMIANPPADPTAKQGHASIAWPAQRLLDETEPSRCVGFVMPRVEKARPLFDAFNPKSRLQAWPLFHYGYLLRTARNLAAAVRALHTRGYVLGDLNESNVLVNGQALVTIVDTDSFQVRDGGRVFRCIVGKPEYAAPEVQGADFAVVDRTPDQDAFALAVLIFQLLMHGAHPFTGRFTGEGEPEPLARRIAAGHWPYAKQRRGPYEPNPTAPPFVVVPPQVRELMRRCFEDGHDNPAARPDAAAWHKALTEADEQLSECLLNAQHHFHNSLDACPWCEMAVRHGRDPFPARDKIRGGAEKSASRAAAVTVKPATPAPATRAALKAKSNPNIRASAPLRRKRTAPLVPAFVLTPWPYLIIAGAVAILVLVGLIVTRANPAAPPARPAGPGYAVRPPMDLAVKTPVIDDAPEPAPTTTKPDAEPPEPPPEPPPPTTPDADPTPPAVTPPKPPPPPPPPPETPHGQLQCFNAHQDAVHCVAVSDGGDRLVTGCGDGQVYLWDVKTGEFTVCKSTHMGDVRCVAFSPDGMLVASGGTDRLALLFNAADGICARSCAGGAGEVLSLTFRAAAGRLLVGTAFGAPDPGSPIDAGSVAAGMFRYWKTHLNEDEGDFPEMHAGPADGAGCMALTDRGRAVLSCTDPAAGTAALWLWDIRTNKRVQTMKAEDLGTVVGLAVSVKGDRAVSAEMEGPVRVWRLADGKELLRLKNDAGTIWCAAFSPKGDLILTGGDDGIVRLWNADTGEEVQEFTGHSGAVRCVAFFPDGKRAVSGGDDLTARVWDLSAK